ncbi:hypothetical protein [Vibrio sp.]|uniref:hypothetical protein n=1 Tax=Vibrio sp. TaxID=678 RepID=UPI003D0FC0AB
MRHIWTITAIAVATITGCTTATRYDDFKSVNESTQRTIDQTLDSEKYEKVLVLERPPQQVEEIKPNNKPSWYYQSTKINAKDMPLSLVLREIVGRDVQIKYGLSVDPAKLTSIFHEGTKEEALNILALNVNYGLTVERDVIKVDKFMTKSYSIPTTVGENSFQLGSSGTGSSQTSTSDAATGSISTTGGNDGQFANTVTNNYNLTDQIYGGINKILSGEGNITTGAGDQATLESSTRNTSNMVLGYAEVIKGLSSIVVRTSPAMMLLVDDYVDSMVKQLNQEVELEIMVLQYQRDEGLKFGIDADISRDTGKGILSIGAKTPSFSDALEGVGVGFNAYTSGVWAGSSVLINALRQTGSVSVQTQQTLKATNHQVQEIDLSTITGYYKSVKTSFEGADKDVPITTIITDEVRDGVKMFAVPNIQADRVHLKLNGVLSKVVKFDNLEINELKLKQPRTRQSRFNMSGSYEYNKTFVVTHMRQTTNESNETDLVDIQMGNSGTQKIVDTLVILTPRLVSKI